jgi:hypothetical protein
MGLRRWLKKLRGDEQAGSVAEEDDKEPGVDIDAIKVDQEAGRIAGLSGPDEAARMGPSEDS